MLDVFTSMGDGDPAGPFLRTARRVRLCRTGERWHGSPALPTEVDYRSVAPAECGTARRFVFGAVQLLNVALLTPLVIAAGMTAVTEIPLLVSLWDSEPFLQQCGVLSRRAIAFPRRLLRSRSCSGSSSWLPSLGCSTWPSRRTGFIACTAFTTGSSARSRAATNSEFFVSLFGDSSYVVGYLLATRIRPLEVQQTGSNFGTKHKHDTPYLTSVGTGSLISDGLSIINTDYSSTSFRVSSVSLGARSFLGNMIAYPSQAKIGDNCLLATKVMVPIDGEIRQNVGLLGSPPFEIPRSVERDSLFDQLKRGEELGRRLAAKNEYNTVSIALYLLVHWFHAFIVDPAGTVRLGLLRALGRHGVRCVHRSRRSSSVRSTSC